MEVYFTSDARRQIIKLGNYIANEIRMPETASKYISRMENFALKIGTISKGYSLCNNKALAIQNLRCATFDKKWIFAFKEENNFIIIYKVMLGKLLP